MHEPWNPTTFEVREWAYTDNAVAPCEDWDLALNWAAYVPVYMDFVADPACPNCEYFLHILYFMVGYAVRNKFQSTPQPIVEGWLDTQQKFSCSELETWAERSRQVLEDPESFDYEYWCGYGHEAG